MTVETQQLNDLEVHMRRVLAHSFQDLNEDDLIIALCLWQEMYTKSPQVKVSEFIGSLANVIKLPQAPDKYIREIFKNRFIDHELLSPDPWPSMVSKKPVKTAKSNVEAKPVKIKTPPKSVSVEPVEEEDFSPSEQESWLVVANDLLNRIEKRLCDVQPEAVSTYKDILAERSRQFEMSQSCVHVVERAARLKCPIIVDSALSKEEVANIVHTIYVWGCEYFGPADAESFFERVLQETEKLPESSQFTPRAFI